MSSTNLSQTQETAASGTNVKGSAEYAFWRLHESLKHNNAFESLEITRGEDNKANGLTATLAGGDKVEFKQSKGGDMLILRQEASKDGQTVVTDAKKTEVTASDTFVTVQKALDALVEIAPEVLQSNQQKLHCSLSWRT